jgi:hypothetical protein
VAPFSAIVKVAGSANFIFSILSKQGCQSEKVFIFLHPKFKNTLMKKFGFVVLIGWALLSFNSASAQYAKGDNLLNLGIGVNSYYGGGIPLGVSYEYGITEDISVGAGIDYLSYRYNFLGDRSRFNILYLGARGSYHFNNLIKHNVEELDLYAGLILGYRSFSWSNDAVPGLDNAYDSNIFFGIHAGARYYFKPNIGAFLELGAGGSGNARLGVAFKF